MKNSRSGVILLTVVLAAGIIAIFYSQVVPPPAVSGPEAAPVAAVPEKPLEQKFQDVLNNFLRSVAEKAQAYKTQRKVIAELVKPQNLMEAAHVQENHAMMEKSVTELQEKSDDIMNVFRETETQIRPLIETEPPEKQQAILESWRSVRDRQANLYFAFFASERETLQTYRQLMQFYFDRQGGYTYDVSTENLLFQNPADKQQEQVLREKIKMLDAREGTILGAPPGTPAPAPAPNPSPGP